MASREEIDALIRGADRILREAGLDPGQMPSELSGTSALNRSDEEYAFGQNQDDFQDFQATDKGFTVDIDETTGRASSPRKETFQESRPIVTGEVEGVRRGKPRGPAYSFPTDITLGYEGDVAPKSALVNALERIQQGTEQFGYDAFPGSAGAEGELIKHLRSGQEQFIADRELGAGLVRADLGRQSTAAQLQNEMNYRAELESAARQPYAQINAQIAQENLSRANIRRKGEIANIMDAAVVDGVYIDPLTRQPIAVSEPATDAIAGANTPNTSQQLNAPKAEDAVSWAARQVNAEGTLFEGRKMPQVDITGATTSFADAVRALPGKTVRRRGEVTTPFANSPLGQVSPNIRSLDELQKVSDLITRLSREQGVSIPRMEQNAAGKMVARKTDTPGVTDVLNYLGLGAADQQQLAVALDQMEKSGNYVAADGEGTRRINEESVKRYSARSPEGSRDMSEARRQGRYIPGMTALGKERDFLTESEVAKAPSKRAAQWRGSEVTNPDARQPFIGAVVGDERPMSKTPGDLDVHDTPDAFIRRQAADRAIANMKGKPGKAVLDESRISENQERARNVREGAGAIGQVAQERRKRQAMIDAAPFMFGRRSR